MNHAMSRMVIRAATVTLPAGPVRERYRQEFLADLYVFDRRARLAFAFGILINAFALRAAAGGDVLPVAQRDFSMVRKPLSCRLHLHFRVRCVNADGTSTTGAVAAATTSMSTSIAPIATVETSPPASSAAGSARAGDAHATTAAISRAHRSVICAAVTSGCSSHHITSELTRPIHTAPRADVSRSS